MESVLQAVRDQASMQVMHQVAANELLDLLDQYSGKIKTLSLDCFDTLLWRKYIEPKDVFFDMQHHPVFQTHGISALNRVDTESHARGLKYIKEGHHEVNLEDIYKTGYPSLNQTEINKLIEAEIEAEVNACYGYPHILELIRAAHQRGLRIIVVSNTYLMEHQLRHLLASVLPEDIFAMLSKIFCSCDYNYTKNNGLFVRVLQNINEPSSTFLHIGDNHAADFASARHYGLNAAHLIQFNNKLTEYLRMQSVAATLIDTSIHHLRPMSSPFRGLFATAHADTTKPESLVGYFSMGPIMYAFARYLNEEIEQLKREGKRPKVLFMMRDAYLPSLACEALTGNSLGTRVRISRFCAIASSFRNKKDIESYLVSITNPKLFEYICKQLLITEPRSRDIIQRANSAEFPSYAFAKLILEEGTVEHICQQSTQYWLRMKKYLLKEIDLAAGDTVVFVDIGYLARAQRVLTPIFKNDMDIDVIGRYFISLNALEWQKTRSGLLDPSHYDDRTLQTICNGASLLEELCCSGDKSVVDFDEDGNPIFSDSNTKSSQIEKTKLIQSESLRFINDAKQFFSTVGSTPSIGTLRDAAITELTRRSYFPTKEEIEYLDDYRHEVNFGTDEVLTTVENGEKELRNLRHQGLTFSNLNAYGLRYNHFMLPLTQLVQGRHGFGTILDDLTMRREPILTLTSKDKIISKQIIDAISTYDGYFSLWIHLDKNYAQIAMLFGINYKALQIDGAELITADTFYSTKQKEKFTDITPYLLFNQMNKKEDQFFECVGENAALIIPTNALPKENENYVLRVTFRPIIRRIQQDI